MFLADSNTSGPMKSHRSRHVSLLWLVVSLQFGPAQHIELTKLRSNCKARQSWSNVNQDCVTVLSVSETHFSDLFSSDLRLFVTREPCISCFKTHPAQCVGHVVLLWLVVSCLVCACWLLAYSISLVLCKCQTNCFMLFVVLPLTWTHAVKYVCSPSHYSDAESLEREKSSSQDQSSLPGHRNEPWVSHTLTHFLLKYCISKHYTVSSK